MSAGSVEIDDLVATLQRERDQLDLLLDVTNAVVAELDTRELFRAVAPALRRCCSADVAALAIFDAESGTLEHHVCDTPADFCSPGEMPRPLERSLDGSASGIVFTTGKPRIFSLRELEALSDSGFIRDRGIRSVCSVPLATAHGVLGTLDLGAFADHAFSPDQFPLLTRIAGQIAIAVRNAMSYQRIEELNAQLAREKLYLEDEIRSDHLFEEIIGRSRALHRVLREIETVAPTDSTVLITGETGSGKELVARAIHQLSGRHDKAFVKLNCAAIPTGLLESELFGHEKGAFTGAITQRIGRFELATRGTVFLDEVAEIPLELQPKLLRVLQEREFERLGSTRTLRTDARLIAATNRDLAAAVAEQKFRQDLFYRLDVFPIHVPALRERREDIPMLVRHFAQQFARRMKKGIETIPTETMDALTRYAWPGNIRELQNLIERAVILSTGSTLVVPAFALRAAAGKPDSPMTRPDLPAGARRAESDPSAGARRAGSDLSAGARSTESDLSAGARSAGSDLSAGARSAGSDLSAGARSAEAETLQEIDRRHIISALERSNWVIAGPGGAAARLGLKRSTLQFRMRKLGIVRPVQQQ